MVTGMVPVVRDVAPRASTAVQRLSWCESDYDMGTHMVVVETSKVLDGPHVLLENVLVDMIYLRGRLTATQHEGRH